MRRLLRVAVAVVLLALTPVACSNEETGAGEDTCDGSQCTCPSGESCILDVPDGGSAVCEAGTTSCSVECHGDCSVTCGETCKVKCAPDSTCAVSCTDSAPVTCSNGEKVCQLPC